MSESSILKDKILPLAQLMRLANVFTAVADVWMGFLVMWFCLEPLHLLGGLTACSCFLYTAGMILNDAADARIDAVERPERPIPSGKFSRRFAYFFGWSFLLAGMLMGLVMSVACSSTAPGLIAWVLGVIIVAYNSWMKHTWLGPIALGACRALNIMLGMSPFILQMSPMEFLMVDTPLAPVWGMGFYVCGIGWLAKEEHKTSRRAPLFLGVVLLVVGLGFFASAPMWDWDIERVIVPLWAWLLVWGIFLGGLLKPLLTAIRQPSPGNVQGLVGISLMLIIPIDAALAWGYADWKLAPDRLITNLASKNAVALAQDDLISS